MFTDEEEKEQKICAIYMAIRTGHYTAAHRLYDNAIQSEIHNLLEIIIKRAKKYGYDHLVEELAQLKDEYD